MPKAFEDCVKNGGKVRTKSLPDGRYQRICIINGKTHAGEVRKKKDNNIMDNKSDFLRFATTVDKTIDMEKRTMVATLAAPVLCHSKTVLWPDGIGLSTYQTNPIVLWSHMNFLPPIGKNVWIKHSSGSLVGKTQFAKRPASHEGEWLADVILDLYDQDILRAVSVGVRTDEQFFGDDITKDQRKLSGVKDADRFVAKSELLEYSCCTVPLNPGALRHAMDSGLELSDPIMTVLGLSSIFNDTNDDDITSEFLTSKDIPDIIKEAISEFTKTVKVTTSKETVVTVPINKQETMTITGQDIEDAFANFGGPKEVAKQVIRSIGIKEAVQSAIAKARGRV